MSWGDDAAKLHAKNLLCAQFIKGMHQRVCVAGHRLHLCDECHIRRENAHALSDIFSFHAEFDFLTHRDFVGVYFLSPLTARDVDHEWSGTSINMRVSSQCCNRY